MNTTYLHRAKRQDNNEWVEGSLVHDPDLDVFDIFGFNYYSGENGREREEFSYRIIPETIGQYTGKEIAENRITDLHCYEHMRKVFVDDVIVIYSVHYGDADNLMRDVVATVCVKWDEEYHIPFAECIKGSYGDISSECDISYLEDGFDLPFTYFIEYMENSTSPFWDWEVIGNAHDNPELL